MISSGSIKECLKNTIRVGKCLIWNGSKRGGMGYAQFSASVGTGSRSGHREVFIYFNGSIPVGYDVGHRCDVPLCINPKHLVLQTRRQNIRQALSRGRLVSNWDKAKIKPGSVEFSRRVSVGLKKYYRNCKTSEKMKKLFIYEENHRRNKHVNSG